MLDDLMVCPGVNTYCYTERLQKPGNEQRYGPYQLKTTT